MVGETTEVSRTKEAKMAKITKFHERISFDIWNLV
jgi:hypothetical protein